MFDAILANFIAGQDGGTVLVAPENMDRVTTALRALANHKHSGDMMAASDTFMQDDFWPASDSWQASYKPYVVKDGILQIPVKGVLLNNFPFAVGSYATGYYYIQKCMERGLNDGNVRGIALVCDSPGGHVAGCFELADKIFSARSEKPIAAFAHEHAYSAAYALASSAARITMSKTGGVGSIGVMTMHVSQEKALEQAGIAVTLIYAGKHKVDGNGFQALSPAAKDRIQERLDETYGVFCAAVARNRKMDEKAVRKTEALTFGSSQALENGLADKVGALDEALADFSSCLFGDNEEKDHLMAIEQKDVDAAVAAARTEASTTAASAAVTAERARVKGIKACDEAKDRPLAAAALAENSSMSVEDAKAVLASMPKETKAPATNAGNPAMVAALDGVQAGPGAAGSEGQGVELTQEQKDQAWVDRITSARFGAKA